MDDLKFKLKNFNANLTKLAENNGLSGVLAGMLYVRRLKDGNNFWSFRYKKYGVTKSKSYGNTSRSKFKTVSRKVEDFYISIMKEIKGPIGVVACTRTFADLVGEHIADVRKRKLAYNTLVRYEGVVKKVKDRCPEFYNSAIGSIAPSEIYSTFESVTEDAPTQADAIRATLKAVFSNAIKRGLIEKNPYSQVSLTAKVKDNRNIPKVVEYWNMAPSSIFKFCDAFKHRVRFGEKDIHNVPLFLKLCAFIGLRKGEVLALRHEDFVTIPIAYGDNSTSVPGLKIHRHLVLTGKNEVQVIEGRKTGQGYRVQVPPWLWEEASKSGRKGWLFPAAAVKGIRINPTMFDTNIPKKVAAHTDLRLKPHQLRAWHATWASYNGLESEEIQRRLGHDNANTTEKYIKPGGFMYSPELDKVFDYKNDDQLEAADIMSKKANAMWPPPNAFEEDPIDIADYLAEKAAKRTA